LHEEGKKRLKKWRNFTKPREGTCNKNWTLRFSLYCFFRKRLW